GRGVYLLSFLPESDVNRIIEYAASTGKRSFAALLPENAYGNVVEAAFKQAVGRRGGRIVAFEKYGADRAAAARNVAQALGQAYDAVALVAALARTQGSQRFSPEVLTNPSGFAGIDGLFRFRADGTNERGLAVMKVTTGGGVPVAGSPKSFGA